MLRLNLEDLFREPPPSPIDDLNTPTSLDLITFDFFPNSPQDQTASNQSYEHIEANETCLPGILLNLFSDLSESDLICITLGDQTLIASALTSASTPSLASHDHTPSSIMKTQSTPSLTSDSTVRTLATSTNAATTGDKKYECTYCNKRYSNLNRLKTHTRTHTGEKPFSCDICKRMFTRSDIRNRHYRTHSKVPKIKAADNKKK